MHTSSLNVPLRLCCYVFAEGGHVFWTLLDAPRMAELKRILSTTGWAFLTQTPTSRESTEKTQLAQANEIYYTFLTGVDDHIIWLF